MKHLKNFEGITSFFRTKKVTSFAKSICEFINSHIDFSQDTGSVPQFLEPFKVIKLDGDSNIAIISVPSYTSAVNFDVTSKNIIIKIPSANFAKTEQYQNVYIFLTAIFSQFSEKIKRYHQGENQGERIYDIYEVDILELPKILSEITQENFDLYTVTSKYNL